MLTAINEISLQQAQPTEGTNKKFDMLIDYAHTYPNTIIRYKTSYIQLYVDSDMVYLVLTKICSRRAGHFYLSNKNNKYDEVSSTTNK